MNASVSPGRIAALALLVGTVAVAIMAIAAPVARAYRSYDVAIAAQRAELARYQAMLALRRPLEARLGGLEAQRPGAEDLLAGGSASGAGAQLQDMIKRHIAEGHGFFVSAQDLPAKVTAGFERVGVRVQFTVTIDGLTRALHAIESGRPLLFVEAVDVRGKPVRKGQEFDRTRDVPLDVTLDVIGFRRKDIKS